MLCLCDRLAHYAVRLSPIQARRTESVCVTINMWLYLYLMQMTPPPQPVGAAGIVGAVFGVLLAIAAVAILVLIILFALLTLWKHKSKFPLHKNSLPKTSSASPTVELVGEIRIVQNNVCIYSLVVSIDTSSADIR